MPHAQPSAGPEGVRLLLAGVLLLLLAASTSAAAPASHEQDSKDAVMVVVGRVGCGDDAALLEAHCIGCGDDAALLEAHCSYTLVHTPPGSVPLGAWAPGPLHSQQQVPVTGLPACTHSSGATTVFVLHRTGGDASWRAIDHAQLPASNAAQLLQSWLGLARVPDSCGLAPEPSRFHRQLMQAPAPGNGTRAPPPAPTPAAAVVPSPAPRSIDSSDAASTNSTNSTNSTVLSELQPGSPGAARILGSQNPNTANLTAAQARVLCALQVEVGPCRASLPRWAYNVAAGACQEFAWGGCDGNGNNFASAGACEATCGSVMTGVAGNATASGAPTSNPAPILVGPVDTTLEPERRLARVEESTPAAPAAPAPVPPPPTSGAGQERSRAGKLLRAVAAGTVGALAVLLL